VVDNVDMLRTSVKLRIFDECYNRNIVRIKHNRPFNRQMHLIHEYAKINNMPDNIVLAFIFRMR
jgi:hypothetical protein